MAKMTVVLEDELWQAFRVLALRQGRSASVIIREFVEWYVATKGASDERV